MCQIIHRVKGAPAISETIIKAASLSNRDGWGIMYSDKGQKCVIKSLEMSDLSETIKLMEDSDFEFVAHLRLGTHGSMSIDNTHPFDVFDGEYSLMHNGIFNVPYSKNETRSDTGIFVDYLNTLPKNIFFLKEWVGYLHSMMITSGNKLAIMNSKGTVFKYGNWFSLPESNEEYEKYKDKLFFSTSPSSFCYDPSKSKNLYSYTNTNTSYKSRYSYKDSGQDTEVDSEDDYYTKQLEAYAYSDNSKEVYNLGGTTYTISDLEFFNLSDLEELMDKDPTGVAILLRDLIILSNA